MEKHSLHSRFSWPSQEVPPSSTLGSKSPKVIRLEKLTTKMMSALRIIFRRNLFLLYDVDFCLSGNMETGQNTPSSFYASSWCEIIREKNCPTTLRCFFTGSFGIFKCCSCSRTKTISKRCPPSSPSSCRQLMMSPPRNGTNGYIPKMMGLGKCISGFKKWRQFWVPSGKQT